MDKEKVNPNMDFADSELESFNFYDDNHLFINIKSWDAKSIKIEFADVIFFTYKLGFQISDFYRILSDSDLLREALSRNYETVPMNQPYKLFQINDIDDFPFIQIVAKDLQIFKE